MVSLNYFKDYFVLVEFELLPDLTKLYGKNSLRRNSGHPATPKQTLFIRFPAVTVLKETSRCLQTRRKRTCHHRIATQALSFRTMHGWKDHQIDFDNSKVSDKGDYRVRQTLKSWHTAMTHEAGNNSRLITIKLVSFHYPAVTTLIIHFYSVLFHTFYSIYPSIRVFLIIRVGSRKLIDLILI